MQRTLFENYFSQNTILRTRTDIKEPIIAHLKKKLLKLTLIFLTFFLDPSEVKIVKKECFNRWYGLVPYYLALTFSRLPIQVSLNVLFSSLVYWLAGLPAEWWRFVCFASIGVIVCLVADGLGLLIGATFSVTVSS